MTAHRSPHAQSLPDPVRDSAFYRNVPAKRLLAWIIDSAVVAALTAIAIPFTVFLGLFILPLLWLSLSLVYRIVTLTQGSATWGMRFVGIELRTARGARFESGDAIAHTVLYTLCISFALPQIASIAFMLITDRGQGLPDLALGTVALNGRR